MLDRVTVQADAEHPEELEPILKSLPKSETEKPILRQLPVEEVRIIIQKTEYEELQEAISSLRFAKFKSQSWHHSPYMAGGLLLALSIVGIVMSAMTIDKYGRRWGVQPQALDRYHGYAAYYDKDQTGNAAFIPGICDQLFPLKNICKNSQIISQAVEQQCHDSMINCSLHDLARECFVLASNICKRENLHEFDIPVWQKFIMAFACIGFLIGAGIVYWRSRYDVMHNTNHMNNAARASMNIIAAKYDLNLDYQAIDYAISELEKKAEEVSRPARRRAFLSAGLEENQHSPLHRFFKGIEKPGVQTNDASKNPFASADIKRIILDYAGLAPKTRLGR